MKLLQAKKDRVKITEKVIDKKEASVEKVNKILHRGQRREAYVSKKKEDEIVFGKPEPEEK